MDGPLELVARSIRANPHCLDFVVERKVKTLYHAIADQSPIDVLAITHPTTSTEFFVGWTAEGPHRLGVLRPGPFRDRRIQEVEQNSPNWTEEYRKYRDDDLNRRAYLFIKHGRLDAEIEAPFYGIWVAEEASLHRPGHDDRGEVRSDGREGLCRGMFATAVVDEVVQWLVETIASLRAQIDEGLPQSLEEEQLDLRRWHSRVVGHDTAELRVAIDPAASRVQQTLDKKRLYAIFPRDPRGRPRARLRVLLQPISPGSDRERRPWIAAVGPSRAGGEEITIKVESRIGVNQAERYDLAPWCWRTGSADLEDPRTWGYSPDWDDRIELFTRGLIREGLEASGLRLDEAITQLARGSHIGLLHPDPTWPKVTRDRLARLAPWLLLGPGIDYARSLLKRKSEGLRLFTLPNQTAIRKASIVLVPVSEPALEIRWTGTNARLPSALWQRPPIPGVWAEIQAT